MISENVYPVRNVPSIVYSANQHFPTSLPSVASPANFDFTTSLPSVASPANFETIPLSNSDVQSVSDLDTLVNHASKIDANFQRQKRVDFVPSNENEFVAIPSNDILRDSRFHVPTYTKKRESDKNANSPKLPKKHTKDSDDYVFQFYIGSLSIIGLLILFRFIQKS